MKKIKLNTGRYLIVDKEDYDKFNQFKWYETERGYVQKYDGYKKVYAHHLSIGKPPKGLHIDHINRNKKDNRKSNLYVCTSSLNVLNAKKFTSGKTSKHIGVCKCVASNANRPWIAYIGKKNIGFYKTEKEAVQAREKEYPVFRKQKLNELKQRLEELRG